MIFIKIVKSIFSGQVELDINDFITNVIMRVDNNCRLEDC